MRGEKPSLWGFNMTHQNHGVAVLVRGEANQSVFRFERTFHIGRDNDCEVQLFDDRVSRMHAQIIFDGKRWWLQDLESQNGTYIAEKRTDRAPLTRPTSIEFGPGGPILSFVLQPPKAAPVPTPRPSQRRTGDHKSEDELQKYLTDDHDESIGEQTRIIRKVVRQARRQQKQKYLAIIAAIALVCIGLGIYAAFKNYQVRQQEKRAQDLFYQLKSLELDLAQMEQEFAERGDNALRTRAQQSRDRLRQQQENYQQSIEALGTHEKSLNAEEKLIYRMAYVFGECELNMPKGFVNEVKSYIRKWQSTALYKESIERAQRNGYTATIVRSLQDHDLPPQFFYLALQESNFKPRAVGPITRYGYAKGMWQFIPMTARRYRLRIGPLSGVRQYDPQDERHDFQKSTQAASEYLQYIYTTEAKASGLLVMAAYNWGEHRVGNYLNTLPPDPQDRNFWKLLTRHKKQVPQQTYDYVFYIFSAAVIGENPRLFGFDFDNPLQGY